MPFSTLCDAKEVAEALGLSFKDALRLVLSMEGPEPIIVINSTNF